MEKINLPSLGSCVDSYYEARAVRHQAAKEVELLKEKEATAELLLLDYLRTQGLEGAKGNVAVAAIKRTTHENVTDREALEAYILANKDLSMLQFRPSITRLKELWDEGEVVPGVESYEKESISLTKVSKK
jgi:hypothetical protein